MQQSQDPPSATSAPFVDNALQEQSSAVVLRSKVSSSSSTADGAQLAQPIESTCTGIKRLLEASLSTLQEPRAKKMCNEVIGCCRRVVCRARGLSRAHKDGNAFIEIPNDAPHGLIVVCSHPECGGSGRKFRFCKVCDLPVVKRNFLKRHGHGLILTSQQLKYEVDNLHCQQTQLNAQILPALTKSSAQNVSTEGSVISEDSQNTDYEPDRGAFEEASTSSCTEECASEECASEAGESKESSTPISERGSLFPPKEASAFAADKAVFEMNVSIKQPLHRHHFSTTKVEGNNPLYLLTVPNPAPIPVVSETLVNAPDSSFAELSTEEKRWFLLFRKRSQKEKPPVAHWIDRVVTATGDSTDTTNFTQQPLHRTPPPTLPAPFLVPRNRTQQLSPRQPSLLPPSFQTRPILPRGVSIKIEEQAQYAVPLDIRVSCRRG